MIDFAKLAAPFPPDRSACACCGATLMAPGRKFCSHACSNRARTRSLVDRFWDKVDRLSPDECWLWKGSLNNKGYPKIMDEDQRLILASHVALSIVGVIVTVGLFALHSCDNPRCVNASHLFVGTHVDNMQDMLSKNRGRWRSHAKAY